MIVAVCLDVCWRRVARSTSMSPSPRSRSIWTLIVPVKQITLAKSRLTGVDDDTRQALAVAFARDTVAAAVAASAVAEVVVVSNDRHALEIARGHARLVPDSPDAGLNPALEHAARTVRARNPRAAVAAMSSDLPALRADDLDRALGSGPEDVGWFVPDADGNGTTLIAAPDGVPWRSAFGPGSRRAHLDAGFAEIVRGRDGRGLDRLRRDVDTRRDLDEAVGLGVGAWTADVLAQHGGGPLA
jgi:2-phospho-L-lactate guanylyltransferase